MARRKADRNPHGLFTIEGDCHRPQAFSYLDLKSIHDHYQIADVGTVDETLAGTAVRLRKLIDIVGPGYGTHYLTIESLDGVFSASLTLEDVRTGIVIYEKDGKPLSREDGGPARFVIPYFADKCANVKALGRLVISREPGRDTRPSTKAAHDALHEAEKQG